jgi:hypothetical protein
VTLGITLIVVSFGLALGMALSFHDLRSLFFERTKPLQTGPRVFVHQWQDPESEFYDPLRVLTESGRATDSAQTIEELRVERQAFFDEADRIRAEVDRQQRRMTKKEGRAIASLMARCESISAEIDGLTESVSESKKRLHQPGRLCDTDTNTGFKNPYNRPRYAILESGMKFSPPQKATVDVARFDAVSMEFVRSAHGENRQ